jgi:hypothetical protein
VIEHETFGPDGWPFDLHAGSTGDEELSFVLAFDALRKSDRSVLDLRKLLRAFNRDSFLLKPNEKNGEQLFTGSYAGQFRAPRAIRELHALDAKPRSRFVD